MVGPVRDEYEWVAQLAAAKNSLGSGDISAAEHSLEVVIDYLMHRAAGYDGEARFWRKQAALAQNEFAGN